MKRMLSVALAVVAGVAIVGVGSVALAHGPGWGHQMGMGWGYGPQGMGPGMMWGGQGSCAYAPGGAGAAGPGQPQEQITEEKARELAAEYAGKYFKGFTVERVLPYAGRHHTMYQVELKGPKGEMRYLHVTPWGGIRPFGGPLAATTE